MLVLARKVNEAIRIGDDIVIKIVSFKGHCEYDYHGKKVYDGRQVRVAIDAPKDVRVVRDELPPLECDGSEVGFGQGVSTNGDV